MIRYSLILLSIAFLLGCESQQEVVPVQPEPQEQTQEVVEPERPTAIVEKQPEPEVEEEKNRAMQGVPVNIRAKAYEEMCERTPESVLCTKE